MSLRLAFQSHTHASDFSDRMAGIQIIFGKVSELNDQTAPVAALGDEWALAIQNNSGRTSFFQIRMAEFEDYCQSLGLKDVFVTKSDHSIDDRWYIFGDLKRITNALQGQRSRYLISERTWSDAMKKLDELKLS